MNKLIKFIAFTSILGIVAGCEKKRAPVQEGSTAELSHKAISLDSQLTRVIRENYMDGSGKRSIVEIYFFASTPQIFFDSSRQSSLG
jgi:hypothetical protein